MKYHWGIIILLLSILSVYCASTNAKLPKEKNTKEQKATVGTKVPKTTTDSKGPKTNNGTKGPKTNNGTKGPKTNTGSKGSKTTTGTKKKDSANSTVELNRQVRMTGGYWAKKGQFPYHAYILTSGAFVCGGSLIHKRYVLTAAHCVFGNDMKFNAWNAQIWLKTTSLHDQINPKVVADVEKVFAPRNYITQTHWYLDSDIAILKLKPNPDILDKWVIKLPKDKFYNDKIATISGSGVNKKAPVLPPWFGHNQQAQDVIDGVLRFQYMKIIRNSVCKTAWGQIDFSPTLLCARTEIGRHGSICMGDSGGALVIDRTVIGVVSIGTQDCNQKIPEVFTHVSKYLDFIKKVMNNKIDGNILSYDVTPKLTNPFLETGYTYPYIF